MHQILWMISSLWKTNFMRSSLMSSSLLMLGNFSCMSFFTPRLMPTGTTFKLLQEDMERVSGYCKKPHKIAFVWRYISAFTLKTIIGKSCLEVASYAPLNWRQENNAKLLTNDETPPLGTRDHNLTAHIFLCCWGWAGKQELNDQNMHEPSYLLTTKRTTTSAGCKHHKSQKTILASHVEKHFIVQSEWITLCTLIEGNMFWNMVAISLTCMPSMPKLFSTSKGWWENCCSCILCLFKDETTSLMRVYWNRDNLLFFFFLYKLQECS